jgi:DNA polymerase-3 subunit epsilon
MSILEGPLVFVDLETNGLSYVRGRIIEVAAIRVENGVVTGSMNQLLDPGAELPRFITELTGITSRDVRGAPAFHQVAEELYQLLEGAVFVAHNVRFDYSFLKQEFKRLGRDFSPRQLCTMRLSRALFPQERSHKLESIIQRHNFITERRHRAYDDAEVLWRFLTHLETTTEPELLQQAVAKQLKQPSLPKGLQPETVAALPDTPGVYIFEDKQGHPLYVGKSVHIRQRVKQHFMRDHEAVGEFKIAQQVHAIQVHETAGELGALLLESRLVKELQPLHNKQLRRTSKLLIARQSTSPEGYAEVMLEEANGIEPGEAPSILGVYATRSKARTSLDDLIRDFSLCPKLCGVEKTAGPCFLYQLHKCYGACVGKESSLVYNQRLHQAFARKRIQAWPYSSPVLITEGDTEGRQDGIVVDQWCVVGQLSQEPDCEPRITTWQQVFDLDTYKILQSHLTLKERLVRIAPLTAAQLQALYI